MKILFIGKRFYTNRDALTEKYGRIYQLPYHWAKVGIDTTLWLIDYHSYDFLEKNDDGLKIISTPVKNGKFFCQYKKEKINSNKPDVIIASGDCYIGFLGYRLAKMLNVKFVFDVYDKYDEFDGYIKPLGFNLFNFLLKNAESRFFASNALFNELGQVEKDILVINGIDADRFKYIDKSISRKKMNLPDTGKLIGYFGSMEPDRGVEDLIEAIQILLQKSCSITITLILGGNAPKSLNLNQPNVSYLGNIPFNDIPYALSACDILVIPYRRSTFMDAGASNKIAEAMACMRPIVATQSPNLITNFKLQADKLKLYLAEPSNPESLAIAIERQLKDCFIVEKPNNIYWNQIANNVKNHIEKNLTI